MVAWRESHGGERAEVGLHYQWPMVQPALLHKISTKGKCLRWRVSRKMRRNISLGFQG